MERLGICALGNLIADRLFDVARDPAPGALAAIQAAGGLSVGGLACNIPLALARLDSGLPLQACGVLGADAEGDFIRAQFARFPNIDTSRILTGARTAYTLVINDLSTRERTFFTDCGAGGDLDADSVDLSGLPARILHAGYILLMPGLDREDAEYGTRMARLLARARALGMKTSVDVVTEAGGRFRRLVPPALKHTDYCVINELEAQAVSGVPLRDAAGALLAENMPDALRALKDCGVSTWAAIHCPEGAYGLDEGERLVSLPSLRLPEGYIKGTAGAGDAFCAGVLYAAHGGWQLMDALRLGTACAALSLGASDSCSNILPVQETLRFYHEMGGR